MTVRNLEHLFKPASVAVIGASDRPHSLGATVLRNLRTGGFRGTVYPVNPKHIFVAGSRAYPDVGALPETPELAVICTPPQTVPGIIAALGARGTQAAIVLSAGLGAAHTAGGKTVTAAMLEAARPHLLRVLGPNCVGLLVPGGNRNFKSPFSSGAKVRLNLSGVKHAQSRSGNGESLGYSSAPGAKFGDILASWVDAGHGRGPAQGAEPNGGGVGLRSVKFHWIRCYVGPPRLPFRRIG